MVDTVRTRAALQALLADNTAGDISAQDTRDFLVSVFPPQAVYDIERYTAGNITVTSTTGGAALPSAGTVTVPASAGDLLMIGVSARMADAGTGGESMRLDAGTIVSAAVVNYLSSLTSSPATTGVSAWFALVGTITNISGELPYVVQAGDISGGNVEIGLRAWLGGATDRVITADTAGPLVFWARKAGQAPA